MDSIADAELVNMEMALVERLRAERVRVPPYPAVATRLQVALQDERCGARELAALIASDSVLSAAVLRRAKSAATRSAGPITLEAAVSMIGASELVAVVLGASLGVSATAPGPLSALRRDTWRASLLSARICHALAVRRRLPPHSAMLAGLLHDFGAIVVVATLEDLANPRRLACLPESVWHDLVERYHVEFGMVIAARWSLPDPVAMVIARHHGANAERGTGLIGLVATVDRVIALLECAPEQGLSALQALPELDDGDRDAIAAAVFDVARQLESFEHVLPPPAATIASSSLAQPSKLPPEQGWPLDVPLELNRSSYRVTAVWPDRFAFRGRSPTQPNWLADAVLAAGTGSIPLLVNVRSCERDGAAGDFLAIGQPYGLAGSAQQAWMQLVQAARKAA